MHRMRIVVMALVLVTLAFVVPAMAHRILPYEPRILPDIEVPAGFEVLPSPSFLSMDVGGSAVSPP